MLNAMLLITAIVFLICSSGTAFAANITGRVLAGDTLEPLQGAYIELYLQSGSYWMGDTYSLADGTYEFYELPPDNYVIHVLPPPETPYLDEYYDGKRDQYSADAVSTLYGDATGIEVILDRSYSISGQVTASDTSEPLGGVSITAYSKNTYNWLGQTYSLTDGSYTLSGLPAAPDIILEVNAPPGPYLGQYYNNTPDWDSATLVPTMDGQMNGMDRTGINISIKRGYYISGHVVGAGVPPEPLMGAMVQLYSANGDWITEDTSQVDGSFSILAHPASGLVLKVLPPPQSPYAIQFYDRKFDFGSANRISTLEGDVSGLTIRMQTGYSISGQVKAGDTLEGLNGCSVDVYNSQGNWLKGVTSQWSGQIDGYYNIDGLPAMNGLVLHISCPPPYVEQYYDQKPDFGSATPLSTLGGNLIGMDITLTRGFSISGMVRGGNPLQGLNGCEVYVYDSNGYWIGGATTQMIQEVPGRYRVEGLPAANGLVVKFWTADGINKPQFYQGKETWETADRLSTIAGDLMGINADLLPLPATEITGKVKDSGGTGIPNKWVQVFSDEIGFYIEVPTNAQGVYSAKGMPAATDYVVSVPHVIDSLSHEFFYKTSTESVSTKDQATRLTIVEEPPSRHELIDIILDFNQGGIISGRVLNPDGHGEPGVWVNAWSEGGPLRPGVSAGASTDAEGYYQIWGLPEVTPVEAPIKGYIIEVYPYNYPYMFYHQPGHPDPGPTRVPTGSIIDFQLINLVSISGWVKTKDANGSLVPVAGAEIQAWSRNSPGYGYTTSNETGYYEILDLMPARDYVVNAFHPDYPQQFYNGKPDEPLANLVDLTLGSAASIDFQLLPSASIKGQVFIGPNPAGSGVWVEAWSEETRTWGGTNTESDGSYEITGLNSSVSDYVVSAWKEGYPSSYYNDRAWVTPPAAGINITLSNGYTMSGSVTRNGIPVPNVRVETWASDSGGWGGTETTDVLENGANYTIDGLVPGQYAVWIYAPAFGYLDYPVPVQVIDRDVAGINFDLDIVRSIKGIIYNLPDGKTLTVDAWSPTRGFGNSVEITGTGAPQGYQITPLKPAPDYVVAVFSEDYPVIIYDNKYDWFRPDFVDVSDGNQSGIDFILPAQGILTDISGTVTFPNTAVNGEEVWIDAYSPSNGFGKGTPVRFEGQFVVPYSISGLINATDYLVSIWSYKYKNYYYLDASTSEDATPIDTTDGTPDDAVDFKADEGASISGKVSIQLADGTTKTLSGIDVEAWSERTGSWGYGLTEQDGTYIIKGLENAKDFIVWAWHPEYGSFYYNKTQTVRSHDLATPVDTSQTNTDIDITMSTGKSIFGKVMNQNGQGLAWVWVDAWSEVLQSGEGVYTDNDGAYLIKGLPDGRYDVTAWPAPYMPYVPKTESNVQAGSGSAVNITLSSQAEYNTVSGTVKNSAGTAVAGVEVELWSDTVNFNGFGYGWGITDKNGKYEIKGISDADDYMLRAWPPINSKYALYSEKNISVQTDITKDITLPDTSSIKGTVYTKASDGTKTVVNGAWVYAYSDETFFWGDAFTNQSGVYEIKQVPQAADYVIVASVDGYLPKTLTNQSPGFVIDFVFEEEGGSISGTVKNEKGQAVQGAHVEAHSQNYPYYGGFAETDVNGEYTIQGLKKTDPANQNILSDYVVSVATEEYPSQSVLGKSVGDTVDFQLTRNTDNTLSGTVKLLNGDPVPGTWTVRVKLYESGGDFYRNVNLTLDDQGNFTVLGLKSGKCYNLKFLAFIDGVLRYQQWSAGDGSPIPGSDGDATPAGAGQFCGGDTVDFKFDTGKRSASSAVKDTTTVRNLRSDTHPTVTQGKSSNNPNITVKWESTADGVTGETYYYLFNTESSYPITLRNAPSTQPVSTTQTTSSNLTGDSVDYYFHVAPVNDRGIILGTASIGFRIDTVPPKNVAVNVSIQNDSANTGKVTLQLGATGATQMQISNTTYGGTDGNVENLSSSKEWTVENTPGENKIYVQFKDEAGNVTNTLATVTISGTVVNHLAYAVSILQIMTGTIIDITGLEDRTGDSKLGTGDVIWHLQKAANLRN
jgi:hypothetical protein